jgi:3'(2'), 5'-bisphosphate nucleotidase
VALGYITGAANTMCANPNVSCALANPVYSSKHEAVTGSEPEPAEEGMSVTLPHIAGRIGDAVIDDDHLAVALAEAAGRTLVAIRESGLFVGRELGQVGDAMSEALLSRGLQATRSGDAVLSEEAADHDARLSAERVWVVDPLDGTREYGEGRSDWAVHVALTVNGVPGPSAVALPGLDLVLSTAARPVLGDRGTAPVRIAVSRSRPPAVAERVAARLQATLVPMGSAGFKAMAVLRGEADAYLHAGGQYEWDSAAPVGVALAAGLHASRIDGSPLVYNRPDPRLPDLLICRPELAGRLLDAVARESPQTDEEA